jgi:hypothetical protein
VKKFGSAKAMLKIYMRPYVTENLLNTMSSLYLKTKLGAALGDMPEASLPTSEEKAIT